MLRMRFLPLALILGLAAGAFAGVPAGYSGGVYAGGLIGRTDYTDKPSGTFAAFARYTLSEGLDAEVRGGYGRLDADQFATDLGLLGAGLVYSFPGRSSMAGWQPLAHVGLQGIRHDIADYPPYRIGGARSIAWGMGLPIGIGARRVLSTTRALEVTGTYTYTFTDEIDGRDDGIGTDWLFHAGVSLVVGNFEPTADRPAPAPEAVDTDGDGLTDDAERRMHKTNPRMADSDMDGLTDGAEVNRHRTDPNNADTDGDGLNDGDELPVGRNPLVADAPAVEPMPEPMPEPTPEPMPEPETLPSLDVQSVHFAVGSAALDAEAKSALDGVASIMERNMAMFLIVRGHASAEGGTYLNRSLSRQRAQAVHDYLVGAGIAGWRVSIEAEGEMAPVESNDTAAGRRANRRVELIPTQY